LRATINRQQWQFKNHSKFNVMKKQSIILGVIAVVFAASAAFATNAISEATSNPGWYRTVDDSSESCTELLTPVNCDMGFAEPCTEDVGSHLNKIIYSDEDCTTPLTRQAGF
jgi:hypothetical protein